MRRRITLGTTRKYTFPVDVLHLLWGGQSCPGVPSGDAFQAAFSERERPSRGKGRLKAGCSQDWLPYNLGGMVSRIEKYAALDSQSASVPMSRDAAGTSA